MSWVFLKDQTFLEILWAETVVNITKKLTQYLLLVIGNPEGSDVFGVLWEAAQ
jgi:hypothetical protein